MWRYPKSNAVLRRFVISSWDRSNLVPKPKIGILLPSEQVIKGANVAEGGMLLKNLGNSGIRIVVT